MHRGKRLGSIMPKALRSTMAFVLVAATVFSMASLALIEPVLAAPTPVSIERVSVPCAEGDDISESPSISADGRYVAFQSSAGNLVAGDNNDLDDIFVRDRLTGEITRVSVASNGAEGNGDSAAPSISADGHYVAFDSSASNLLGAGNDNNGWADVFVHDRQTGETTRVSVTSDNAEADAVSWAPQISADGRFVVFESEATNLVTGDTNGARDVFVRALGPGGTTTRVSVAGSGDQANGRSLAGSISADGRYVAFESEATNLVTGDTNAKADIFVRDLWPGGTTTRVSLAGDNAEGNNESHDPSISADGRYVAFLSYSTNLTDDETGGFAQVFVRDRTVGQTTLVSVDSGGSAGSGGSVAPVSMSADSRYVAFASDATNLVGGDDNGHQDIFVRDLQEEANVRVSVDSSGSQSDDDSSFPAISADGRYVAFASDAANLTANDTNLDRDIFVRDVQTSEITRVSLGGKIVGSGFQSNGVTNHTGISEDGRYVAFQSDASNLVDGDTNGCTDIFVRDRWTGETSRVSVDSSGAQANGSSECPSISADGRYVAFQSEASNLVSDNNGVTDVFGHDRQTGETVRVSLAYDGSEGDSGSYAPCISADNRYVAFESDATNLVANDTNGSRDVFVRDMEPGGTVLRVSVRSNGNEGADDSSAASISEDGRYVAFQSSAGNLVDSDTGHVDVFVRDCQTDETTRVSVALGPVPQGNGDSLAPSISADGRYVAFESAASNLVIGDTNGFVDIFLYDREALYTTRVSGGAQPNADSYSVSSSADGQSLAFESDATNLVASDDNSRTDIFLYDMQTALIIRLSVASSGTQGNGHSYQPRISADGGHVAFESLASNLVLDDTNGIRDAFVVSWENPVLGYVPTSIDFGAQYQDSTENATLQVQNTGTGILTYSLSENSTWCSVTPDSGESSIEPDGFLVAIDTSGLVPGDYGCSVIISSNGGTGIVPVHVSVQPTPAIGVSPGIHDFGTVELGSSAEQVITVSNSGTGDLVIGTVAGVDPVEAPYSIVSDDCSGQTVLPGDNTTLTVRFSPTIKGEFNEIFDIPSNDPHTPSLDVDITGETPNTPPTVPVVSITPDSPDTAADLVCNITTESTDPDGDNVTYAYKWFKDGVEQTALTGNTVGAAETAKDQDWKCVVTPKDDWLEGQTAEDEVTIQNAAPAAPVVNITPDSPDTTADLVCAITTQSTDLDGDAVTYSYQWYKGGVVQVGFTTSTVGAAETARDQVWKCVVAAGDGILTSALAEDEVTIQDAAPTAPVLAITPESPSSGDDLVCSIATASDDADGDNVTYSYQWYKDGELQTDLTTDTVGAGETGDGQVWKCVVTPSDGILDGPSAEAEVTILAGGGLPAAAIAGIVIGVLAVAGAAGFLFIKRPKKAPRF